MVPGIPKACMLLCRRERMFVTLLIMYKPLLLQPVALQSILWFNSPHLLPSCILHYNYMPAVQAARKGIKHTNPERSAHRHYFCLPILYKNDPLYSQRCNFWSTIGPAVMVRMEKGNDRWVEGKLGFPETSCLAPHPFIEWEREREWQKEGEKTTGR